MSLIIQFILCHENECASGRIFWQGTMEILRQIKVYCGRRLYCEQTVLRGVRLTVDKLEEGNHMHI